MNTDPREIAVRARVEEWMAAVRMLDVERAMALYAPEVVAFDAVLRLQCRGEVAYQKHWHECMASCPFSAPIIAELHQLEMLIEGELAVCWFLQRCGGPTPDGGEQASWMRGTQVYRCQDGDWRIIHEHFSAPFDPVSGAPMFDVTP
jgi:ketosteroid isomerase-like protein